MGVEIQLVFCSSSHVVCRAAAREKREHFSVDQEVLYQEWSPAWTSERGQQVIPASLPFSLPIARAIPVPGPGVGGRGGGAAKRGHRAGVGALQRALRWAGKEAGKGLGLASEQRPRCLPWTSLPGREREGVCLQHVLKWLSSPRSTYPQTFRLQ